MSRGKMTERMHPIHVIAATENRMKRTPSTEVVIFGWRFFWVPAAVTTALTAFIYGPSGPGWQDFGVFMLSLFFIAPAVFVAFVGSGIWVLLARKPEGAKAARSYFLAMLAPLLLASALLFSHDPLRDPVRYAVWSIFHQPELASARQHDGIFKHWDSWGFAGAEGDSYLASDPKDTLSSPGMAEPWGKAHRLPCWFEARRLARGIFLLSTSECSFDENIQTFSVGPARAGAS